MKLVLLELNNNLPYSSIIKKINSKGVDQILLLQKNSNDEIDGNLNTFLRNISYEKFLFNPDKIYSNFLELYVKISEMAGDAIMRQDLNILLIYHINNIGLQPIFDMLSSTITAYFTAIRYDESKKVKLYFEKIVSDEKVYFHYVIPGFPMSKSTREYHSYFSYLFDQSDFISSDSLEKISKDSTEDLGIFEIPSRGTIKKYYSVLKSSIETVDEFDDRKTRGFCFMSP